MNFPKKYISLKSVHLMAVCAMALLLFQHCGVFDSLSSDSSEKQPAQSDTSQ